MSLRRERGMGVSADERLISKPSTRLVDFVTRHPLLTGLLFSVAWIVIGRLIYLTIDKQAPSLPYIARSLADAGANSLLVALILAGLGWWQRVGLTRLPHRRHLPLYIIPLLLTLSPFIVRRLAPRTQVVDAVDVVILWLLWALLTGFAEEGVWRGILVQAFRPRGLLLAALIPALLFGLTHLGSIIFGWSVAQALPHVVLTTGMGLMYGALALLTGSIWPTIVLHSSFDFLCQCPTLHMTVPLSTAVTRLLMGIGTAMGLYGLVLLWWEARKGT